MGYASFFKLLLLVIATTYMFKPLSAFHFNFSKDYKIIRPINLTISYSLLKLKKVYKISNLKLYKRETVKNERYK